MKPTAEQIIVKKTISGSSHIQNAGHFDVTLIGTSNTGIVEQLLTPVKIGFGAFRGRAKVFFSVEPLDGSFVKSGKGYLNLFLKDPDITGFQVFAAHDVPAGESTPIRVHWFAFGYEGEAVVEE